MDAEHALDPTWARKCGVNLEQLLVSQPNSGEEALEITEMLIRSGSVDTVVVDSVAALIPKAEIEGQMGDAHVALQARLLSQAMRKLTAAIAKTRTVVIFINQIRMKIGVMFGNPETTPGGRALKFYSSVRLDVRRISAIKEGDTVVGNHVRAKVVKNKVAAPFREGEFDIMFDGGISREGDLLDLAMAGGVVVKSGAWFSYGDVRLGQGRENSRSSSGTTRTCSPKSARPSWPRREARMKEAEAARAGAKPTAPATGPGKQAAKAPPPPAATRRRKRA